MLEFAAQGLAGVSVVPVYTRKDRNIQVGKNMKRSGAEKSGGARRNTRGNVCDAPVTAPVRVQAMCTLATVLMRRPACWPNSPRESQAYGVTSYCAWERWFTFSATHCKAPAAGRSCRADAAVEACTPVHRSINFGVPPPTPTRSMCLDWDRRCR